MKRMFSLAVLAIIAIFSFAQSVHFGVRGGLNISKESDHKFLFSDGESYDFPLDWRVGFTVGGLVNIETFRNSELEVGLSYSMLGFKDKVYTSEEPDGVLDHNNVTVTSHYLVVPIVEKYYPLGDGLYFELGPQFGFLLSKKGKFEEDDSYEYYSWDGNNKTFDFALLGGVGYRFKNKMFFDARYIHSFTKTCDLYGGGKNRAFQISLGYLF